MRRKLFFSIKKQTGFTLMELTVVGIVTLGALSLGSSLVGDSIALKEANNIKNQGYLNALLASRLTEAANSLTTSGDYSDPFTGDGYFSSIADPADTTLGAMLVGQGVDEAEVNEYGGAKRFVRVYQLLPDIQRQTPLFGQSGGLITLEYSQIAVYSTRCRVTDTSCNVDPLPGDSATLTGSNVQNYTLTGEDYGLAMDSNLKNMLDKTRTTATRINTLRDRLNLMKDFNFVANGDPADTSNFYPVNPGATIVSFSASANQGCLEGWIDLSTTDVLASLNLGREEFGVTAWGGSIEYCRKFDVNGTIGTGAPHWAALRVNALVSRQLNPVGGTSAASNTLIQL